MIMSKKNYLSSDSLVEIFKGTGTSANEIKLKKVKDVPQEDKQADGKQAELSASGKNNSAESTTKKNMLEVILVELYDRYSFIEIQDQLYVYIEDQGYWKLIQDDMNNRELRRLIPEYLRTRVNKANLGDLYECLLVGAEPMELKAFEKNTDYINFRDVAYNWKTKQFETSRKDLYFRYCLDVDFPEKKSTGAFNKFLKDVFKNDSKETVREFSKFVGLCISDIRVLRYSFFLYGPSGSGKSVMMNLLRYIVGSKNCSSISFSQMSAEFGLTQLCGKRLNLSGEVSGTTTNRIDIFKSLTGNDDVTANRKNQSYIEFKNRCILIFGANALPTISDYREFEAFIARIIIFPFANSKPRDEWDNKLLDKLKKDIPGIINFALEGLALLKEDNFTFHESESMLECKKSYNGSVDSFTMFINKYIVKSPGDRVASADISKAYKQFCNKHDYLILSDNKWPELLKRKFFTERKTIQSTGGGRVRAYTNIALTDSVNKLLDEDIVQQTVQEVIYQENMKK